MIAPNPGDRRNGFPGSVRLGGAVVVAWAAIVVALWIWRLAHDPWPAYDTHAYWLAGRHVLDGTPLYRPSGIADFGAFKYPPLFAQLVAPLAVLPEVAVFWAWRAVGAVCLRYLAGSWRLALICCAVYWPFLHELNIGNVTLEIGAILLLTLRDRRAACLLPWLAALKVGPALLIPYLWLCRPDARRPIVAGSIALAIAVMASVVAAPGLWRDYAGTFGWEASSRLEGGDVIALLPGSGGLDFALRLALACGLVGVAIWRRLDGVAFVAGVATNPILTISRLAPLLGLWPLYRERVAPKVRAAVVAIPTVAGWRPVEARPPTG